MIRIYLRNCQMGPMLWPRVQVLAARLPIQLPANEPRKAVADGPNTWATAIQMGDLDRVPNS